MRVRIPRLRAPHIAPGRASVLRYGVAVLSTILALIPALLLANLVESRLVVFAVAIMVSAWYGGWKPGLVATTFAITVVAYFSLAGQHSPEGYQQAIIHLGLFVFVAGLICWSNGALRAAQDGLRRSESHFRTLVNHAPYGIARCDERGTILSANPAFAAMLGGASASELTGRDLITLHLDAQQWFALADHLSASRPFSGLVADWRGLSGKTVVVRLSGSARREGKTKFFEIFAEDVTETRALEQQFRQSQKMEAIGRLAGGISHDFNNLLMVISGYCEILAERAGNNPAIVEPAHQITAAADRATALTRQLLAFSRQQMLTPKVLDLNTVVTENLKLLTRLIGEDIDLVMVPGKELGAVKTDPGQIEQVIMNLAINARDAMPRGGKLTIETSNVSLDENYAHSHTAVKPGEYIMLAVSDTGAGMDAETQNHIFEPFFTTKGTRGTGLGLSTVYGIVKQSEGYIWVYSEPGKGTTFKIYLPRVHESGEAVPVSPANEVKVSRGNETILLVEDETTLRGLVKQYLQNQGYTVLEASDGNTAIRISADYKNPIHLLLTDVIMPGMNGREVASRVSALRPRIKVLYVSGYTENAIGHNGLLEEGVTLLQKPFTLPTLKAKVREMLDQMPPLEVPMSARAVVTAQIKGREKLARLRAKRFALQLPMKYRSIGENGWHSGTTENISRSGMLFRAENNVSPNEMLEIHLVLPAEIAGLSTAEVICRGEVVRTLSSESPTLAARILQYHFQHSKIPA